MLAKIKKEYQTTAGLLQSSWAQDALAILSKMMMDLGNGNPEMPLAMLYEIQSSKMQPAMLQSKKQIQYAVRYAVGRRYDQSRQSLC